MRNFVPLQVFVKTTRTGRACPIRWTRATYEAFKRAAEAAGLGDLVERVEAGYLEETPGDGIHWLYLTDEVRGNIQQVDQAAVRLLESARAVNSAADRLGSGSRALSSNTARFNLA